MAADIHGTAAVAIPATTAALRPEHRSGASDEELDAAAEKKWSTGEVTKTIGQRRGSRGEGTWQLTLTGHRKGVKGFQSDSRIASK